MHQLLCDFERPNPTSNLSLVQVRHAGWHEADFSIPPSQVAQSNHRPSLIGPSFENRLGLSARSRAPAQLLSHSVPFCREERFEEMSQKRLSDQSRSRLKTYSGEGSFLLPSHKQATCYVGARKWNKTCLPRVYLS